MDVADLADDDDLTEAAMLVQRNGLYRRSGPSAYRCEECGDAIPEHRRQDLPGIEHCDDCLITLELLQKRGIR